MTAYEGWAILELMGHRRRAGQVSEVELASAKLLRLDIPAVDDEGAAIPALTEFYGGAAIYCLTPCAEDVARRIARAIGNPHPVAPMAHRLAGPSETFDHFDDEDLS